MAKSKGRTFRQVIREQRRHPHQPRRAPRSNLGPQGPALLLKPGNLKASMTWSQTTSPRDLCRVEMWRGGLGAAYLCRPFCLLVE